MFWRVLSAFLLSLTLFVGSLALAPAADQVAQTAQVPAFSAGASAYTEGDLSGCSNQYGWCWVQFCSAWGMGSGGYVTFVTNRYGNTLYENVYPGTIYPGCNNWARKWFEGNRYGYFVYAGDPVYWIGSGQIQT